MQYFPRYCFVFTAVLTMTLLALSVHHRLDNRRAALRSLHDWDIPQLADYLHRAGLELQLHSPSANGRITRNAYLTVIPKNWEDLNRLGINPGPSRIHEWDGIVYCERTDRPLDLWDDEYLVIGPFYFYGDAELLERISVLLDPSAAR